MAKLPVHVVVLNYNGAEDTIACIRSLQSVVDPVLEIVVVDNASTDDSVLRLRGAFPGLTLIESPRNTGYSGGNNLGIRHSLAQGAEYVLVMNNDVTVTPDFLLPMIALFDKDRSIGVATCKVHYQSRPDKVFAGAGRFNWWLCTGMNKGGYIERYFRNGREEIVDFACGVLFLVRREVFEVAGYLDERYFMYFEDVEFSRRVVKHFRMGYTPLGVVFHKSGGGTSIRSYTKLYNYYHTRNRLLTFSEDVRIYRWYVVAFTLANVIVKSAIQLPNGLKGPRNAWEQITALWRGFADGMSLMKGGSQKKV